MYPEELSFELKYCVRHLEEASAPLVRWIERKLLFDTQDDVAVLSKLAQIELSLFREYRTRLIADVVTGKLDVRDAAVHLPELNPIAGGNRVGTIQAESNAHTTECGMARMRTNP